MTTVALNRVQEKADTLVKQGRVTVLWSNGEAGHGIVDGYHGTYFCSYSPAGRVCTCPMGRTHRDCSHGLALEWQCWQAANLQLRLV